MASEQYLHGYAHHEQERLIAQAAFWRDSLILPGLQYHAGDRVLEVGCGVGACLRILAEAFPGIRLAGIDIAPAQVEYARRYLGQAGLGESDLREGDASELPWEDNTFDRVFMMWILEHVENPEMVLREALRVLKPGGTISCIEADYRSFLEYPRSEDYAYLRRAQHDLFARKGLADIGRMLGPLLVQAGFRGVANTPYCFHYFNGQNDGRMKALTDYITDFMSGYLEIMADTLSFDLERLKRGHAYLKALHTQPGGSFTKTAYKGSGVK